MNLRTICHCLLLLGVGFIFGPHLPAAATDKAVETRSHAAFSAEMEEVHTAEVTLDGTVLFRVRGVSAYPAEKRAKLIAARIKAAAADPTIAADSLRIEEGDGVTRILAGKETLLGIFDADARIEGIDRKTLATALQASIGEAIDDWRHDRDPSLLKRHILYALGGTLVFVIFLLLGQKVYRRLRGLLDERLRVKVKDIKIQRFKLVRGKHLWQLLTRLVWLAWTGIVLVGSYLYLHGVLSLFPWTRGFADRLFTILLNPLHTLGRGLVDAIPNLVFLVVLFFITRYVLKLVRLFFTSIEEGKVSLEGFEAEWAWPTYRLLRVMLVAFTLVIAYPYIPGSDSGAFKGISIFIGVLFSLGSSSIIGNLIAGYTMTYRRAFKTGDRIRVGDHVGDVLQSRLLVTYLRTPKNEEVVIPNSVILGGEIVNYSSLARQQGLILHTTVGIGYETPWRQVEAMLLEAASRTTGLLPEPAPFVHQKGLGDFCVTYEINVYCGEPQAMGRLYSELHRNILDVFNEYGVQIMTPAYEGDPERPKVVPKEQWYAAPAKPPKG